MLPYRFRILQNLGKSRSARKAEEKWSEDYLHVLQRMFPGGKVEGDDFRTNGEGDRGRRVSFQLDEGRWTDFGDDVANGRGVLSLVAYLEGWDGVAKLLREHESSLDIPLYPTERKLDVSAIFRLAEKRGLDVARRYEYRDTDGYLLGVRVRYEDKKTREKEFRLLSYRSRYTRESDSKTRIEGWRLEGGWGEFAPIYGAEMFADETDPRPVLINEGEKAADAARERVGSIYRCITWGDGGARGVGKGDWSLIPEDVEKTFWPDKDTPGKKAADKLAEKLPGLKIVDVWAQESLSDADDLADVPNEPSRVEWVLDLIRTATASSPSRQDTQGFKNRYIYVKETEQFIDMNSMMRYSLASFNKANMHILPKLGEELLSDETADIKVDKITFHPGKPRIMEDKALVDGNLRYLNLWTPNDLLPEAGVPDMFLDHLKYVIPEDAERNYFLSYLAFLVQNPGVKIHHAPLLGGEQGIGKSYFVVLAALILGTHNVREITTEALTQSFNSWIEESQLVIVEEVMAMGKREITNRLKPLITSPKVDVNSKGVKAYTIDNRSNFMFFTNHRDALSLDEGDRRFFVYWSEAEPKSEEYYADLFQDLEENAGRILHFLRNYPLDTFNPKGRAPETEAKKLMIKLSLPEIHSEIQARIDEQISPFDCDVVTLRDVCDWAREKKVGRPFDWSPAKMAGILAKAGCMFIGTSRLHGAMNRCYSVRSHELYMGADEALIKKSARQSLAGS